VDENFILSKKRKEIFGFLGANGAGKNDGDEMRMEISLYTQLLAKLKWPFFDCVRLRRHRKIKKKNIRIT